MGSAYIFHNFLLTGLMESGCYAPGFPDFVIDDIIISSFIIGDLAYPIMSLLMKLYGG